MTYDQFKIRGNELLIMRKHIDPENPNKITSSRLIKLPITEHQRIEIEDTISNFDKAVKQFKERICYDERNV